MTDLPSKVLDDAADLIEREGWTSDHHWTPPAWGTAPAGVYSGTATSTTNWATEHPNFNPEGFCILDAMLKVHPQGKFTYNLRASWGSMREPHCGALGKFLLEAIGPSLSGWPEGLVQWNDHPRRTKPEVTGALRKAADLARGEGR